MRKQNSMRSSLWRRHAGGTWVFPMKKIWICLLSVCLLAVFLPPAEVHADVLIEVADSFWESHRKDCDYLFRRYTANGPEGYIALWESPVSSRQEEILANGTEIAGGWRYADSRGEIWCAISSGKMNHQGQEEIRGWVRTSECLVTPDHTSFQEAHGQEFVAYDPAYDHALDGLEKVVLWEYPCSGVTAAEEIDAEWFRNYDSLADCFSTCWEDPQGRLWAYVGYCYGIRSTWICLDAPADASLKADGTVLPQTATVYPPADKLPSAKSGVTGLTVGAVAAVTAVTVLLLWLFFGRKRRPDAS